tara:strand:+ start:352 stop:747 length:396 start_codon:yes stop_codon:yes gene_type:complete
MKFETLDEFLHYHHKLIMDICEKSVENHIEIGNIAFDIWNLARLFANRSYVTLAFDCCYIAANATGNKVSIPLLQNISADLLDGRKVRAMTTSSGKKRWFLTYKGKEAILEQLVDEDLYKDIVSNWIDEEE